MGEIRSVAVDDRERVRDAAVRLDERNAVDEVAASAQADAGSLLTEELPELVGRLDEVVDALRADGMALLRGVPVESDVTLALMCRYVGELDVATERPPSYVEHITPSDKVDIARRPPSQRRTALMPHTDQSARGNPPDYLALACVANEAETGGESVLVPIEPIARHLAESDPGSYDLLQDSEFPIFNVPRRDFAVTAPLLRVRKRPGGDGTPRGHHEVRFRDEAIRAGMKEMNRPSDQHVSAFERLSAETHDKKWWLVRRLVPGDVLFFDNKRALHGRTAILGDHHRDLKRLNGRYRPGTPQRRS